MTAQPEASPVCACGHSLYLHYMCGDVRTSHCLKGCGCKCFDPNQAPASEAEPEVPEYDTETERARRGYDDPPRAERNEGTQAGVQVPPGASDRPVTDSEARGAEGNNPATSSAPRLDLETLERAHRHGWNSALEAAATVADARATRMRDPGDEGKQASGTTATVKEASTDPAMTSPASLPAPALDAASLEAANLIRIVAANLANDWAMGERQCCADLAHRIEKGIRTLDVRAHIRALEAGIWAYGERAASEDLRAAFTAGWNAGVLARDKTCSIVDVDLPSEEAVAAKIIAAKIVAQIHRTRGRKHE